MNIIFTHCSTLIIIADFKLKMSRSYCSYDEEWQRRKSMLIRSLFHDIPILSPVEEESDDSYQDYHPPAQQPFSSPPRPYSPLPPLIIERVPTTNKHDEPEEFYTKLHKKIIKIYVKLFIENRNFSSIHSDESLVNDDGPVNRALTGSDYENSDSDENIDLRFLESISPGNKDFDSIIEDRKARESSASTKSNGYGADFESMDTAIVDVVNHTISTEDAINMSEVEESDAESFDRYDIGNKDPDSSRSSEHITSSRTDNRVSDEGLIFTVEDQVMTEIGKTKEMEIEHSYEDGELRDESIDEYEITNETGESDKVRIDDPELDEDESRHSTINDQEMTDGKDSSEPENEQQTENKTKTDSGSQDSETKSKGSEKTASEGGNGDVETSSSSEDSDYRQITTIALVHFDGSKDAEDLESRVYEDSVRSVILPTRFRRVLGRRSDDGLKILAELEDKDDPKTGSSFNPEESISTEEDLEEVRALPEAVDEDLSAMRTSTPKATEEAIEERRTPQLDTPEVDDEVNRTEDDAEMNNKDEVGEEDDAEMEYPHSIEQMRTPRLDLSRGTMPVTHQSDSESTNEHSVFPQEATMMTSSSQDGAQQNISDIQTSNDMNDILTSIFNDSRNKNGTPVSAKKRKLVDKSIQAAPTMRVTWEEMRVNFFVGTPKIFRLCACTDHICL